MSSKSSRLRVLLVAARYFPEIGGVEIHVYEVARRLVQADHEVTVLTTDLSGRLPLIEESEGIHIRRVRAWPTNKDYYFAPGIYSFITRGQWDLVHCQGYHTLVAPVAMFAARRANIPYVLTFHSGGHSSYLRNALRGLQWMMLRPLLSRARMLIAVSEFEATFFREQLRLPPKQFVIIPNGAHLPEALKSAQESRDEAGDGPLIVSIGRLERYKGHQRLIAALPKVQEQVPNVRLRIAGTGPYEPALQRLARKLGVAERVEIQAISPGDRSSMASLIRQADLVTLLSDYESQGIAATEALALQRPVLVAGTSALQELADRNLAQAVSPKSTPEEVATAVISQLRQPLVPMNIELPTWDDCAADLLTLYSAITRRTLCAS
jgi:glycosyltransferase involved in cell wall biosynthesis